jgi:chromate transport protein ChrA
VQLAVLYERVGSLSEDVEGMRRALWATVTAVVGGALLFLFSEAAGWIGPHGVTHAMHAFLGAFT